MSEGAHFAAAGGDVLRELGIELSIGTDFYEYRRLLAEGRPNQPLGAPFDPDIHNLNTGNAFWMLGRNAQGELMHSQASRFIDLKTQKLSGYLLKHFREFPPTLPDIDLPRSRYRAGPGANRMSGRVIYHGEAWMGGEAGQYRGSGLSTLLARYNLLITMQRWNPDHVFGFLANPVAFKGFGERMGYMHTEPGAVRWFRKGSDKVMEGFLCYLSNEDIRFLLDMPVEDLVAREKSKAA